MSPRAAKKKRLSWAPRLLPLALLLAVLAPRAASASIPSRSDLPASFSGGAAGELASLLPREEPEFHLFADVSLLPETRVRGLEFSEADDVEAEGELTADEPPGCGGPCREIASGLRLGLELDPDLGWYYTRNRWYDPETGAFINVDPLGYPDSANPYVWPVAAPWAGDPLGLQEALNPRLQKRYAQYVAWWEGRVRTAEGRLREARRTKDLAQIYSAERDVQAVSGLGTDPGAAMEVFQEEQRRGRKVFGAGEIDATDEQIFRALQQRELERQGNAVAFLGGISGGMAAAAGRTAVAAAPRVAAVRVFRVEGTPNTRVLIGEAGEVAIQGEERTLFLNFGSRARAEEFLAQKIAQDMPGATIKSFDVPASYLEQLRRTAVPERFARRYPGRPILVDQTKAPDQYGLRPEQIEELRRVVIQGSGRAE